MQMIQRVVRCILTAFACATALSCRARVDGDASAGAAVALRVMTYNIAAGNGDLARVAATIREAAPDVVALQEVDVHWLARSKFADQAAELATMLGMQSRFAPIYQLDGATPQDPKREYGVAVLSRYPIVAFTNHPLTRLSTQLPATPPQPMPGFLDATLDVRGRRVRVFNTHLDYRADPALRTMQVRETLAILGDVRQPMLLFGDLNATPVSPELAPLMATLCDLWSRGSHGTGDGVGEGFSYPAVLPVKRIDYVLGSRQVRVRSMRVLESTASDHRPVIADIDIGRASDQADANAGGKAPGKAPACG